MISIHLDWIRNEYSFDDILSIQNELKDMDPFSNAGAIEIQKHIGGNISPLEEITESDYEKIKYIVEESYELNGNIDFLEKFINIEYLDICGVSSKGKIESLKPLENLKNLKYIDLHSHSISDISPLSGLENLEEIHLWRNPIKTIEPIVHLKNLKNVQLSEVEEDEVFELLKNSTDATVTYVSTENDESYKAVWINGWAFRTKSYEDLTTISITIESLLITAFVDQLKTCGIDYISLMREKSENIALSLQSDTHLIESSTEHFHEDVRFLKVFEYTLK